MAGRSTLAANDGRQLFSVGETAYSVRDVIDAAFFRGEVAPVWNRLRGLLQSEQRAEEEGRELDDSAVDTALQAFRYDHDLITAEETEKWLADRGLTLKDFSDYFERHYWGETIGEVAEADDTEGYFSASPELHDLLIAETAMSGELDRMATRLSWRVAAATAAKEPPSNDAIERQRQEFLARFNLETAAVDEWLAGLGRDSAWLEQMLQTEATYAAEAEKVATPQARQRELGSLRLQLTVFDTEIIEFDSHDAACEALFCVRDDCMSMEQVAADGRYPFHRQQLLLEDIAPDVQQQFLSVSAGEVLEPIESGGVFRLCRVAGKSEPNPEDRAVRQRIEQRLLERHFADLVSQHVRWQLVQI